MADKVHPIISDFANAIEPTPQTNSDFDKVLTELSTLRREVLNLSDELTDLKHTHSAEIADLKITQLADNASLRELLIQQFSDLNYPNRPAILRKLTIHDATVGGMDLANELYNNRSGNHKSNYVHVNRIFNEHSAFLAPLMTACPHIKNILSHVLTNNFGWSVKSVAYVTPMIDFSEEDCQRIATALACFLRKRKTAEAALEVSE